MCQIYQNLYQFVFPNTDAHNRLLWAAVSLLMMLLIYLLIYTVNISNQHAIFYIEYSIKIITSSKLNSVLSISFVPHSNGSTNRMSTSALRTSSLDHEKHAAANNVQTPTLATRWKSRAFWLAPKSGACACSTAPVIRFEASPLRAGEGVSRNDVTYKWNDTVLTAKRE